MIPWMREKFAERRARWHSSRKQRDTPHSSTTSSPTVDSSSTCGSPREKQRNQSDSIETPVEDAIESEEEIPAEISLNVYGPQGLLIPMCLPRTTTMHDVKLAVVQKWKNKKYEENAEEDAHDEEAEGVEKPRKKKGPIQSGSLELERIGSLYKLIRTKGHCIVKEDETLDYAGVKNDEEFLLALKKHRRDIKRDFIRGPTQADIDKATKGMDPPARVLPTSAARDFEDDVSSDIRKVLISMTRASAYILGSGPCASRLISVIKGKLVKRKRVETDVSKALMRMGFEKEHVVTALEISNNNFSEAFDWLINKKWEILPQSSENSPTNPTSFTLQAISPKKTQNKEENIYKNVEALLELLRITCQTNDEPPAALVDALQNMGFEEDVAQEALRLANNNMVAACEWLLNKDSAGLTEFQNGLPKESPVLKALLDTPLVQLSLGNPKFFMAFLTIIEYPDAINMFMQDSELQETLHHILRIFHEEKHIEIVNQLNTAV